MSEIVISVEELSKSYLVGHQAVTAERYTTLRDIIARNARALARKTADMLRGRCIVQGDEVEEFWALKDISFKVKHGEVLGIIGQNGAGKSTLLKILSRITEPTKGRVRIAGRVASLLEVGTGFHAELTGRENIFLNGAILGMTRAEIKRKFDEIVAFAETEKFLDTPVKRYSSGMYVRLAFAVAAHLEPEILIIDEVLAVGDTQFQKKCMGKMKEVGKEGRTVLFVSHNMAAIENLCSKVILLDNGCIRSSGDVDNVISDYLSSLSLSLSKDKGSLAFSQDESVELLSIGPIDEMGHPLAVTQCGRDLNLLILIRTTKSLADVTVTVGINDSKNVRVTVLHSRIVGYNFSLPPGTHSLVCQVPEFCLAAGSYFLDVQAFVMNQSILWAPQVEQLMVEMGDFYKTGKLPDLDWAGVCYLQQRWHIL